MCASNGRGVEFAGTPTCLAAFETRRRDRGRLLSLLLLLLLLLLLMLDRNRCSRRRFLRVLLDQRRYYSGRLALTLPICGRTVWGGECGRRRRNTMTAGKSFRRGMDIPFRAGNVRLFVRLDFHCR